MIDLISTDTMFPEYSTGMDTDEYLRETNNYLFLLRENLQWALRNIGISNFNPEQLNRIGSVITKPIMLTLGKDTDNIKSVLAINQEGVSETITGINNQFTTIGATVNGISSTVSEIQGEVSSLDSSISGLTTRMTTVEQTASGISSTVLDLQNDVSGLGSGLTALTSRVSTVEQTATSISSTVQEISGDYISATSAKQTSGSFSLTVKNGSGSTATLIDKNGLSVYGGALSLYSAGTASSNRVLYADDNGNLYIKGQITATALSLGNGVTIDAAKLSGYIDTARIAAGSITSAKIAANTITTDKIAAGAITGNLIAANTITADKINATNLHVSAANVDGTLTAGHIDLSGYSSSIGSIDALISLDYSSIVLSCYNDAKIESNKNVKIEGDTGISLTSANNFVKIGSTDTEGTVLGAYNSSYTVKFAGDNAGMYFAPTCHCYLGTPVGTSQTAYRDQRWFAGAYLGSSVIVVSDKNRKHDINYDISVYDVVFDGLHPASFKYNDGTSDRTHLGLLAQDTEISVYNAGLSLQDFAAVVCTTTDDEKNYFLRYEEFIPLCIRQIQLLKDRVAALEGA